MFGMKSLETPNLNHQIKEALKMISFYSEELIAEKLIKIMENEMTLQQQILDQISVPIYVKSMEGIVVYANLAYSQMILHPLEDIVGHHLSELKGLSVESEEIHKRMDLEIQKVGRSLIYEYDFHRKDGLKIPVYLFKDLIKNDAGAPVAIIGSIINISRFKERIESQERLFEVKKAVSTLSKQIGEISLADLGHTLLELAIKLICKNAVGSFIIVKEGEQMEWITGIGYDLSALRGMTYGLKQSLQWMVSKDQMQEIIRIDDFRDFPEILPHMLLGENGLPIKSLLSIPLCIEGKVYAYMSIDSHERKNFDSLDVELLNYLKMDMELLLEKYHLKRHMKRLDSVDQGSGLFQRQLFERFMYERLKKQPLSGKLLLLDFIQFHKINDLLGWEETEALLRKVVRHLKGCPIEIATGYRYEGDKFIYCFETLSEKDLLEIEEHVNRIYHNGVQVDKGLIHVPIYLSLCDMEALSETPSYKHQFVAIGKMDKNQFHMTKPVYLERL